MNYILIIVVVVVTVAVQQVIVSTGPTRHLRQKESPVFEKCSSDFLWRALGAAGKGNSSALHFLHSALEELGFTCTGIQARSAAAAWQKQMKHVSAESVFSQLQIMSAAHARNISDNVKFKVTSELPTAEVHEKGEADEPTANEIQTATASTPTSTKWKSSEKLKTVIRKLVKSINRIYNDEDLPLREQKKKRKKLRRLLKEFLRESECGNELESPLMRVTRSSSKKKTKKKKRHELKDAVKICLLMIDELMTKGICEDVEESFKLALDQVLNKYRYNRDGKMVVVTSNERVPESG